jgi:hypothetical protein
MNALRMLLSIVRTTEERSSLKNAVTVAIVLIPFSARVMPLKDRGVIFCHDRNNQ